MADGEDFDDESLLQFLPSPGDSGLPNAIVHALAENCSVALTRGMLPKNFVGQIASVLCHNGDSQHLRDQIASWCEAEGYDCDLDNAISTLRALIEPHQA
jgi:hypothetical protein